MNLCPLAHAPTNELGVVFLFGAMVRDLGYVVTLLQAAFPDCEALRQVIDDAERQREDRSAGALDDARGDEHVDARGQRREQRAGTEDRQREDQRALLAEHVPEAPDDRRQDRRAEQVAREHPRDGRRRGV